MQHLYKKLIFGTMLLGSCSIFAQSSLSIVADSALFHTKQGIFIYLGHVQVKAPTLRLLAHKVILYKTKQGTLQKVVATGKLATGYFWEKRDKKMIVISGERLGYFPLKKQVRAEGHATIQQGGNTLQGAYLTYDIGQHVLATPKRAPPSHPITLIVTPNSH